MALMQVWALIAAVVVVIVAVAVGILLARRHREQDARSGAPVSRAERMRSLPSFRTALHRRMALLAGIVGLGTVAVLLGGTVAARPMTSQTVQPVNNSRDIVLCLDVSGSMLDVDREVIDVFDDLLDGFQGERIGLTIFNSSPVQVFPLTDDYRFIREQLSSVRDSFDYNSSTPEHWIGTLNGPGASLIGDGLTACTMRFDHLDDDRSRSVILATDNEVNGSQILELDEAAGYAASQKVRVYTIDPTSDPNAATSSELADAATSTGGQAYGLRDQQTVGGIITEVQKQQATALRGQAQVIWSDAPELWIALLVIPLLAFILLLWRVRS